MLGVGNTLIMHLERTDNALDVMRVHNGRAGGVSLRQNTMKSLIAKTGVQLMVGGATNVIDLPLWEFHLVEGGAKIQPRAAAEHDRQATSPFGNSISSRAARRYNPVPPQNTIGRPWESSRAIWARASS